MAGWALSNLTIGVSESQVAALLEARVLQELVGLIPDMNDRYVAAVAEGIVNILKVY